MSAFALTKSESNVLVSMRIAVNLVEGTSHFFEDHYQDKPMHAFAELVLMTCQQLWPVGAVSVTQMPPMALLLMQTQRQSLAPTTHKNISFISAPAHF